jgi:hypothetical protein
MQHFCEYQLYLQARSAYLCDLELICPILTRILTPAFVLRTDGSD